MSGVLEFTILGSGSSGGVPRADGAWGDCDPENPKNRRSRCSFLVRRRGVDAASETTVLVDTSPDLRLQTAAAGVQRMDAVLYSHDHADQAHGIDDVRAFFIRWRHRIPAYMDPATHRSLTTRFGYIFESQTGYPAIMDAVAMPAFGDAFVIDGPSGAIPVKTFDQDHGGGVRSVGFRFGSVAYSADVQDLPPDALEALAGVDTWIVDALRYTPHPTHAHVAKTLAWIDAIKPRRAILTNLHIDLDYAKLAAELPENVEPAYDGMRFEITL